MSRSYRGVFNNSVDQIEDILSNIMVDLTEVYRIVTTIKDKDVTDETIGKIDEVEYIIGNLMNELE